MTVTAAVRKTGTSVPTLALLSGAIVFILGPVQYLVSEVITATAWQDPPYSFTRNYVSDLGVVGGPWTFQGRIINSPLAMVMNTALIAEGVLFVLAATLMARLFSGSQRGWFVTLAAIHCVGFVLVGLFHGSGDKADLGLVIHIIGAAFAILSGNLVAIVVGRAAGRIGLPRWFAITSVAVAVIGIVSELILPAGVGGHALDGVWERGGVYSFLFWEIVFGLVALTRLRALTQPRPL
jgi:hypothetical membrane protein